MKRWSLLLLVFVLFIPSKSFAQRNVKIFTLGDYIYGDVAPTIENDRVLVPLRLIGENLESDVKWHPTTQKVILKRLTQKGTYATIELQINRRQATVKENGRTKHITLDVPAKIMNGRTFVPIRFISEAFGEIVSWDDANSTVVIGKTYYPPRDHKLLSIHYEGKEFKVHSFQIGDRRMISVKDFTKGMGWIYSIDRNNYVWAGNNPPEIGVLVTEPATKREVIFHGRGIQCDGIYLDQDTSMEYVNSYLTVDGDYYIPLRELAIGLHWAGDFKDEDSDVYFNEDRVNTRYDIVYRFDTESYDPDQEPIYVTRTSTVNRLEYINYHYRIMPMNKTPAEFDLRKDDAFYNSPEDETTLFHMNLFQLQPKTHSVVLFIGE